MASPDRVVRQGRPASEMRVLALDSATGACSATIVAGGAVLAGRHELLARGQAASLPRQVAECLAETALSVTDLDLVAVVVGPGSFTGTRSAVALAQGMALAAGIETVGVTVGEALGESVPRQDQRALWVATPSRRGRVFIETAGQILSVSLDEIPAPNGPVALAGTAAADVASRLAARGSDIMLMEARYPFGHHIAAVARRRAAGQLPPLAPEPLYVDPPEARPQLVAGNGH